MLGKLCDQNAKREARCNPCSYCTDASCGAFASRRYGRRNGKREIILAVGIVDPYLSHCVHIGEWFYVCLFPNTVTSLRHEWTHPAFEPAAKQTYSKQEARDTIETIAKQCGMSFKDIMRYARKCLESGLSIYQSGSDSWKTNFKGNEKKFWRAFEVITGDSVVDKAQPLFYC